MYLLYVVIVIVLQVEGDWFGRVVVCLNGYRSFVSWHRRRIEFSVRIHLSFHSRITTRILVTSVFGLPLFLYLIYLILVGFLKTRQKRILWEKLVKMSLLNINQCLLNTVLITITLNLLKKFLLFHR